MIALKRILHPTDFSTCSRKALDYACRLAEQFGAELHLLYVAEDLSAITAVGGLGVPPPDDYSRAIREKAEHALAAMPDPKWAAGKTVVRALRIGSPFQEIAGYANEAKIDLIVLGTHGRTGFTHLLLGSVAEKVVRTAPCPVLTVHPGA